MPATVWDCVIIGGGPAGLAGATAVRLTLGVGIAALLVFLSRRTQLAYSSVQSSYDQVTQIAPKDPNSWFNLAQAAQQAGDNVTAVNGYKRYLKLSPGSSTATQIKQLIKQLSPAPAKPSKHKK